MSFLQGDCQPSLLQWCIITKEKTKPSLTELYPLNIRSAFGSGALVSFQESEAFPFLPPSPCVLSSPGFPRQLSGIKSPKGRRLHTQISHISSGSQRWGMFSLVGATRCRDDGGMRNEAQTDLAEISRPFWNDNEPLSLPPGEIRRVSMMMKYFFGGKKKKKRNLYVCVCIRVFLCVCVLTKTPFGGYYWYEKSLHSSLFSLALGAFSLIISKNRDAQNPNT